MQIAAAYAAYAAKVDFDEHLVGPQGRTWPVLQRNSPLFGQHHSGHRHLR
jgi:hypothetical protein